MATILHNLPFFDDGTTLRIPGGPVVSIAHHQIIVWVSIAIAGMDWPPAEIRRFPAVLDIGFNDSFLITEHQLRAWAGFSPNDFRHLESVSAYGRSVPVVSAGLWLHRNVADFRDQMGSQSPFRLELAPSGVAICPSPMKTPRLPLLGMRALRDANLHLSIDFRRCRVNLRTSKRFWFFL